MPEQTRRYLHALDISLSCTGVTIFDMDTMKEVHIDSFPMNQYGTGDDPQLHGKKLYMLTRALRNLIADYPPTEVAMEGGFVNNNKATQAIFKAHGVCNCLYWNVPQYYYQPMSVKAVIWHGKADKPTLRKKIKEQLPHINFKNHDESDSYAVGITHFVKKYGYVWTKTDSVADKIAKAKTTKTAKAKPKKEKSTEEKPKRVRKKKAE